MAPECLLAALLFHHKVSPLHHAAAVHGAEETWPSGVHLGSGGEERVIGLRAVILPPDWTEKGARKKERRGREEREELPLSSPHSPSVLGPRWLHRLCALTERTEMWLLTGGIRRLSVGFPFFSICQPDNGRGETGSRVGHAGHPGCAAAAAAAAVAVCDYLCVRSGR